MARPSPADLTLDPVLLTVLGLLVALIAIRISIARREGRGWRGWRLVSLAVSLTLVAIAFVSPIATAASGYLLTAHLAQVTLLMGVAPPLLLLGLPPARRGRRLPGPVDRMARIAVHPAVAIVLVNAVFFGWHVPAVYDACLSHPSLYAMQMVTVFAVSIAFWWPIVMPPFAGRTGLAPLGKLGYILLATIPQTFGGLLFALARHPFYPGYDGAPRLLGLSALSDQQVAGACMAIISKLALFAAFSVVMWRMLDARGADDTSTDEGGGGGGNGGQDGDDRPRPLAPRAPAWFGLLDRTPMPEEPVPARRDVVTAGH